MRSSSLSLAAHSPSRPSHLVGEEAPLPVFVARERAQETFTTLARYESAADPRALARGRITVEERYIGGMMGTFVDAMERSEMTMIMVNRR